MILTKLAKQETLKIIEGPAGEIELIITQQPGKSMWGIVCHPHSLFGGTMQNKVVTTLIKTFQSIGLNTIRFNFRGVGASTGKFDSGVGELDDLIAVMNWVQEEYHHYEFWLAGFSFGAFVAAKAATKIPLKKLVLVAPPVSNFPMKKLPLFLCPWILVQGDRDEIISAEEVYKWAKRRKPAPIILRFPNASHFFHGELIALRSELEKALLSG